MCFHKITLRLKTYIQTNGHKIDNWCMGITDNIELGLYKKHNVKPFYKNDFEDAVTLDAAIRITKQLYNEFDLINVTDPEERNGTIVFVYKRTDYTNP